MTFRRIYAVPLVVAPFIQGNAVVPFPLKVKSVRLSIITLVWRNVGISSFSKIIMHSYYAQLHMPFDKLKPVFESICKSNVKIQRFCTF